MLKGYCPLLEPLWPGAPASPLKRGRGINLRHEEFCLSQGVVLLSFSRYWTRAYLGYLLWFGLETPPHPKTQTHYPILHKHLLQRSADADLGGDGVLEF